MKQIFCSKRAALVLVFLAALLASGCAAMGLPVAIPSAPVADSSATTVHIYHFSDYHSHALPSYAEGDPARGGIAQVIGLLEQAEEENENVLVFSGGDTMNLNNPIWSDEYGCTEWGWVNNIVNGMALGNHEFDYGFEAFQECVYNITYPLVSTSLVYSDTLEPYLPEYAIYEVDGVKVGAFAVAGSDFPRIVRAEWLPPNTRWLTQEEELERVAAVVDALRNEEEVDVVVSIGHQAEEEDFEMARAVPGIDLILGTHSHLKQPFQQIEGTDTYYIAPFQYLYYVSHVALTVEDGELVDASGELVAIDEASPTHDLLAEKVAEMQAALEARYPERFEVLGEAATLIDNEGINLGETGIGNFVTDIARDAVDAHAFFSTSSSFRAAIPPGPITREAYLTALPYRNTIVTAEMTGAQLLELLELSASKRGSDAFSQISGLRYTIDSADNSVSNVEVLADPTDASAGFVPLDPDATYTVATTNFQAFIAGDYSDLFAEAQNVNDTGIDVNELVIEFIQNNSPVSASIDGRVTVE